MSAGKQRQKAYNLGINYRNSSRFESASVIDGRKGPTLVIS